MITQEQLKQLVVYEQSTGVFTWKPRPENLFKTIKSFKNWNRRYAGEQAGGVKIDSGYVIVSLFKKPYRAHRLAWLYVHGVMPTNQIDHINGVRHDNRLVNLRDTKQGENQKNRRLSPKNKTGHHGIWKHQNGRFRVKAWDKNVQYHLGYYESFEEAVAARKRFEAEHGYHPNHGVMAA
jgi:hypothetical protein